MAQHPQVPEWPIKELGRRLRRDTAYRNLACPLPNWRGGKLALAVRSTRALSDVCANAFNGLLPLG